LHCKLHYEYTTAKLVLSFFDIRKKHFSPLHFTLLFSPEENTLLPSLHQQITAGVILLFVQIGLSVFFIFEKFVACEEF
jgi:hypothetical protein